MKKIIITTLALVCGLGAYAINQAQQRVAYERQATDEMQRQNMAKNAQAKIEDIILTNKIEQLKAQGRMKEAQALVDEREIKRTMAGLQGVSEEDKKKLADMMRQTNGYKVSQQEQRSARSGGTSGGSRGGGDVSSAFPPSSERFPALLKNWGSYASHTSPF